MCIKLPCGYSSQTLTKVVAYCEIALNTIAITICMIFGSVLESRPDFLQDVAKEKPKENQDILMLLELPYWLQICIVSWILFNFIGSLVLALVLLSGAQERNLSKVRIWFMSTIISYLLWLPIFLAWTIFSLDPVNIIFTSLFTYIFAGLCLFVVNAFMEELRIENINHRPGFKTHHCAIIFNKI